MVTTRTTARPGTTNQNLDLNNLDAMLGIQNYGSGGLAGLNGMSGLSLPSPPPAGGGSGSMAAIHAQFQQNNENVIAAAINHFAQEGDDQQQAQQQQQYMQQQMMQQQWEQLVGTPQMMQEIMMLPFSRSGARPISNNSLNTFKKRFKYVVQQHASLRNALLSGVHLQEQWKYRRIKAFKYDLQHIKHKTFKKPPPQPDEVLPIKVVTPVWLYVKTTDPLCPVAVDEKTKKQLRDFAIKYTRIVAWGEPNVQVPSIERDMLERLLERLMKSRRSCSLEDGVVYRIASRNEMHEVFGFPKEVMNSTTQKMVGLLPKKERKLQWKKDEKKHRKFYGVDAKGKGVGPVPQRIAQREQSGGSFTGQKWYTYNKNSSVRSNTNSNTGRPARQQQTTEAPQQQLGRFMAMMQNNSTGSSRRSGSGSGRNA